MNSSYSRLIAAELLVVAAAVALRGQGQVGELVGEGLAVAVAEPEVAQLAVAGEPQLLCQLGLVEQAHLLRGRPGDRLGRLDLQAPVATKASGRRDQLPDDHVLLQAEQPVGLALERRVREDLGGLLERRRRQERVGRERGLGDAEDDLLDRRLLLLGLLDLGVRRRDLVAIGELARQVIRVALLLDADLAHHLTHDQLDVLVVDVDALRLVDLLDLVDEVQLGRRTAADPEHLGREDRTLVELVAAVDLVALRHEQTGTAREGVSLLLAVVERDDDLACLLGVLDRDDAALNRQLGEALRLARLEQLHDTRQTVRDVRAGNAAGVERPQGQLGARLADRLRGDDADRVADCDGLAGGRQDAVALLADPGLRAALEHRADRDDRALLLAERVGELRQRRIVDQVAGLEQHAAALGLDGTGGEAALQRRVDRVVAGQRQLERLLRAAVLDPDDDVLRGVDQTPGQVTRVGRAQGGVREALTGAVGGDEVLEDRQPLGEVRLHRTLENLALRIRHQASHTGELADLLERASGSRVGHHVDRVELIEVLDHLLADLVGRRVPLLDDRVVALFLGDQAHVVLVVDLRDLTLVAIEDLLLDRRDDGVVLGDRDAGLRREMETQLLERVQHRRGGVGAVLDDQPLDDLVHVLLPQRAVDERELGRVVLALFQVVAERAIDALVEDDAPDRGEDVVLLTGAAVLRQVVQLHHAVLVGELGLLGGTEDVRTLAVVLLTPLAAADLLLLVRQLLVARPVGQVVGAQHHVLARHRKRRAVSRRQDVVGRQHQQSCLRLGLGRQREVDGHLVAVEVSVERVTHERVDLDRLALDEDRLERLQTETVQRGSAVQQHGVLLNHFLEHVPDLGDHRVDHLLGRLDVLNRLALDQPGHDERLEQLERHQLRQAALVELELGAGHDDRTTRVVNSLTKQVLTEATLLALEHVRERLQRAVTRAGHRPAAAAVVEQCVDGLLQHALLVVDDDLRGTQVKQSLEAVVPVDHTPGEVVQVRGREAATVELDHRAKLRRDDRNRLEDHVLRLVLRGEDRGDDLEPLDRAALLLALGRLDLILELLALGLQIDLLEQVADGLGAHAAAEVLAEAVRRAEAVLELTEDRLVSDDLLRLHAAEQVPHLADPLSGVLDVGLGVRDVCVEGLTQILQHLLAVFLGELLDVDVERVGPQVVLLVEARLLAGRQVLLTRLERATQLLDALLLLGGVRVEDLLDLLLELRQVGLAGLVVHPRHDRRGEVEDLLELLRRHVQQVADTARDALEEPDVRDGSGQVDVTHALAADLRARNFDATALADDALVTDALVLAAVALPVLGRTENALAEEAVLLGLQGSVVDGLRLGDLAGAPRSDLLRGSEADRDGVEIVDVDHVRLGLFLDVFLVLLLGRLVRLAAIALGLDLLLGLVRGGADLRGSHS